MSLKKFLFSRVFLKNLIIAIAIVILLIAGSMFALRIYTHHGEAFPVPDLKGLTEPEVKEKVAEMKLDYQIIDSVYISDDNPGSVIDQVPKPGFKVKQNRTILLTINAKSPEQVMLPKLRDISIRQAKVLIENSGLNLGEVSYVPSEYDDLVLKALYDSTEVFKGRILKKGERIDLVVGRVSGLEKTTVPDLAGLGIEDARLIISDAMLNMGVIIYDDSFTTKEDSLNARIWRQRPDPHTKPEIDMGTSVDMWVTVDQEKIDQALER